MKNTTFIVVALASAFTSFSQDADQRPPGPPPGGERRPPPIIQALDANHDGKIDAAEIANATAALAKLDKNGDGVLTPDEFMGPRGEGRGPGGPGGPRGQGRPPRPENKE